ncbi:hypothetical protein M2168_005625 [Streptomyces sp. CZ24]|nr:hypothetical protein [Streptomyces sp. CZ24]
MAGGCSSTGSGPVDEVREIAPTAAERLTLRVPTGPHPGPRVSVRGRARPGRLDQGSVPLVP